MDMEIYTKLTELQLMQQQIIKLLERLAGKKALKDDWLDTVAICDLLGVTDRTILRWRKLGLLKPKTIGGKCYYTQKEITTLMEENDKS